MSPNAAAQLTTIRWLHRLLVEHHLDYWLFGGWAVDFHAGRVTRDHEDIDIAVWQADLDRLRGLLEGEGWVPAPDRGEDGYTGYARDQVRLELAFLARDDAGTPYTPLEHGRGEWPSGSFGDARAELAGVTASVVGLAALVEDKAGARDDAAVAAKDRADLAVLTSLPGAG